MAKKPFHGKHRAKLAGKKLKLNLFGFHAVQAAWLNPKRHVHALYMTEAAAREFEGRLPKELQNKRPASTVVAKEDIDRSLPPGTVHQGIALSCQPLEEISVQDLIIKAKDKQNSVLLILDQVTDPHNIGAILRSACAFGADGMILQSRHAPEADGILAKTACGALEHVPIAYETNLSRTMELLQDKGYFIFGLDERGEDIGTANLSGKSVLVLGAEGPGMRPNIKEHCDSLIRLPMQGPMPSINVSNAAAVALYAITKN